MYPSGSSEQHIANKSIGQQHHRKKKAIPKKLDPSKSSPTMSTRIKVPVPLLVQPWELGARKNFIFDEFASLWHVFVVLQVCITKQCLS